MTYTESNRSFVKSILEPYFKEAGLPVENDKLNVIVDRICSNNEFAGLKADNGHDLILQQGLNILQQLNKEGSSDSLR